VFRVSGTIALKSDLIIENDDITIAGQTAPGDGICIKNYPLILSADNVIIRYLRSRLGDENQLQADAISGIRHKNIIIDHCSFSWGIDEVASFYDNKAFTLQWCLISESLNRSYHKKGEHGYGGIWGGKGASFHHNLLAHHASRNPRFNGSRTQGEPVQEIVDFRNNVIYNWGNNSTYGGEAGNVNTVANYYKYGPGTRSTKDRIAEPWDEHGRWFVTDNFVYGYPKITADNWAGGMQGKFWKQVKVSSPLAVAPVTTQSAEVAYRLVLADVGAVLPHRDAVDKRILAEVESGAANYGGSWGAGSGIIDCQTEVGGWPDLNSVPAPQDQDHDGMADGWERANGLDPTNPDDRNGDRNQDGYTNLEDYLNSLVIASIPAERADLVVAQDHSGDFATIQQAIDAIPTDNSDLKIILIKKGVYLEKLQIKTNHIALVGEDRDSTRIEFFQPYSFDSTYAEGRAVINIYANDIILANLTAENTQPNVNIHAFTVYGENNTRTIIINCNILSNGGDTLALWNGDTGRYYLNTINLRGAVDFLCPRGWCYAENIHFFCTRTTTPLWHDGSKNIDQKLVVKNATFDGATSFRLGRNHHDGAFYLLNCVFSEKLLDQPFFRPETSPAPYRWGRRAYFYHCVRPAGNFAWHKDNLDSTQNSPKAIEITPVWTFAGAWDPEATLPSVLPMAFLPRPPQQDSCLVSQAVISWLPGRNALSHQVYFGKTNPPPLVAEVKERSFKLDILLPKTLYYWRIDEVTQTGIIIGSLWQFRTL